MADLAGRRTASLRAPMSRPSTSSFGAQAWMPATSAGMTVEIDASHVGNALVLDAALLFPLRLAAIAGDKGRVLRAEAAVALDHRLSAALERIEGAFLL